METIRIGNDISVQWTILHDNVPEPLEGRDLKVILSNSFERIEIKDFLLVGNVIRFSYHGKDQVHCGVYTLTLFENYKKDGMPLTLARRSSSYRDHAGRLTNSLARI